MPPEDRRMQDLSSPFRPCEFWFCPWSHHGPSPSGKTKCPIFLPWVPRESPTVLGPALPRPLSGLLASAPGICSWASLQASSFSPPQRPPLPTAPTHPAGTPVLPSKSQQLPLQDKGRHSARPRAFSSGSKLTRLSPTFPASPAATLGRVYHGVRGGRAGRRPFGGTPIFIERSNVEF